MRKHHIINTFLVYLAEQEFSTPYEKGTGYEKVKNYLSTWCIIVLANRKEGRAD